MQQFSNSFSQVPLKERGVLPTRQCEVGCSGSINMPFWCSTHTTGGLCIMVWETFY